MVNETITSEENAMRLNRLRLFALITTVGAVTACASNIAPKDVAEAIGGPAQTAADDLAGEWLLGRCVHRAHVARNRNRSSDSARPGSLVHSVVNQPSAATRQRRAPARQQHRQQRHQRLRVAHEHRTGTEEQRRASERLANKAQKRFSHSSDPATRFGLAIAWYF